MERLFSREEKRERGRQGGSGDVCEDGGMTQICVFARSRGRPLLRLLRHTEVNFDWGNGQGGDGVSASLKTDG